MEKLDSDGIPILGLKPWSEKDDAGLRDLFARGNSDEEIAIALGRTVASVSIRRSHLGLLRPVADGVSLSYPWSAEEDITVAYLFRWGWSDIKIAEAVHRSTFQVTTRRQELGLWREE